MTEKTKKIIKDQMNIFPKELQEAINSIAWEKISEEVGVKYLLDKEETSVLQIITGLAVVGISNVELLTDSIEEEIGMSSDEAQKISNELNEKIFDLINASLEANIKKDLKNKTITWQQNLDFVLSGGNYSVFLETEKGPTDNTTNTESKENLLVNFLKNS